MRYCNPYVWGMPLMLDCLGIIFGRDFVRQRDRRRVACIVKIYTFFGFNKQSCCCACGVARIRKKKTAVLIRQDTLIDREDQVANYLVA